MGKSVVVIGELDGLHLGHRALVDEALAVGRTRRLPPIAVVLSSPDAARRDLVPPDRRCEQLVAAGLATARLLHVPAGPPPRVAGEIATAVREDLDPEVAVLACPPGPSLRYPALRPALAASGVDIIEVPRVLDRDLLPITSAAVVASLDAGDVEGATRLLGRPYAYEGPVTLGDQRGRLLGFPTANLAVPERCAVPANGVYAAWVRLAGGVPWPAAVNVGRRPTFYAQHGQQLIEAHLIGFDGDLYATWISVRFVQRLRDERAFPSAEALSRQLRRDIEAAAAVLGSAQG